MNCTIALLTPYADVSFSFRFFFFLSFSDEQHVTSLTLQLTSIRLGYRTTSHTFLNYFLFFLLVCFYQCLVYYVLVLYSIFVNNIYASILFHPPSRDSLLLVALRSCELDNSLSRASCKDKAPFSVERFVAKRTRRRRLRLQEKMSSSTI